MLSTHYCLKLSKKNEKSKTENKKIVSKDFKVYGLFWQFKLYTFASFFKEKRKKNNSFVSVIFSFKARSYHFIMFPKRKKNVKRKSEKNQA